MTLAFRGWESNREWWHGDYGVHKAGRSYATFHLSPAPPGRLLLSSSFSYSSPGIVFPATLSPDWPLGFLNRSHSRATALLSLFIVSAMTLHLPKMGASLPERRLIDQQLTWVNPEVNPYCQKPLKLGLIRHWSQSTDPDPLCLQNQGSPAGFFVLGSYLHPSPLRLLLLSKWLCWPISVGVDFYSKRLMVLPYLGDPDLSGSLDSLWATASDSDLSLALGLHPSSFLSAHPEPVLLHCAMPWPLCTSPCAWALLHKSLSPSLPHLTHVFCPDWQDQPHPSLRSSPKKSINSVLPPVCWHQAFPGKTKKTGYRDVKFTPLGIHWAVVFLKAPQLVLICSLGWELFAFLF